MKATCSVYAYLCLTESAMWIFFRQLPNSITTRQINKVTLKGCRSKLGLSALFNRNVIKRGEVRALYVPQQLGKIDQLAFVMNMLDLKLFTPRCMGCGGKLVEVPKHLVTDEAPPLASRNCGRFWRCERCGKLLWRGTHWRKITQRLEDIAHRT